MSDPTRVPFTVYDAIDQLTDLDEMRAKLHTLRRGFGAMSDQHKHFVLVQSGYDDCQPCRDYVEYPNDYSMCEQARLWQRDIDAAWRAL